MSRNLAYTSCAICDGGPSDIMLEAAPRLIAADEAGPYYAEFKELQVAKASCKTCGAKYLAWVNDPRVQRFATDSCPFVDLSFRSSFNDEPGATDLPEPSTLRRLHMAHHLQRATDLRKQANALLDAASEEVKKAYEGESFWEAYRC